MLENVSNAKKMTQSKDVAGNSFDLVAMQKSMTGAFKSAVREMPHSTTDWGGMLSGMAQVTEEKMRGNDVERTNTWYS